MDPLVAAVLALLLLIGIALGTKLTRPRKGLCPVCRDEIHRGGYTFRGATFCSEACAVKDWEFQAGW